MKRGLLMLVLAGALAGCATGQVVTAPDGYPAIYIRCNPNHPYRCYRRAQRLCPLGYQMVQPPGYGTLLIRC